MTRYTVTYVRDALQDLARLWLGAFDRRAVTEAGDAVDQLLRNDALEKGAPTAAERRQIIVPPLVVEFSVDEEDRIVTIWTVRHIGELTNGL
jgi:plasmid stabilization system protein ParE